MLRTLVALIALVLALASSSPAGVRAPAPAAPAAVTSTTFFVSGRGWGHGVGMSQYGALGFANEGWTYDRILTHFYTGVELGPAPVAKVRVLVAEAASTLRVSSKTPHRVRDVFGKTYPLAAGESVLSPRALRVQVNGAPTDLAGPVTFLPGSAPLELGGAPYRGQIEVAVAGGRLNAVDVVGLEHYLQGVVPREMPSAWPEEALKAQAVAARSYALAHRLTGRPYDLYADVRSQVYGGIASEHPRATAAIQATRGEIMTFEGKVVNALFHSTSGGATADVAEVFGATVPYLVGVDDPHSALSPVHSWGPMPVAEPALRRALKLRAPVSSLKLTRGPSGRVVSVQAGSAKLSGGAFRAATGIRSTWITQLASLSVSRPAGPVTWGTAVKVTGKARGVKGAVLAQRVGNAWKPLKGLSATARLRAPATYRIQAGGLLGPVLRVPVAPLVALGVDGGDVAGTVRPLAPGAAVELQQDTGRGWSTVARATTGVDGEFSLTPPSPAAAGTYRVRVPAVQGFATATTPPLSLP